MRGPAPAITRSRRERLTVLAVIAAAAVPYVRTTRDYFVQDDFGVVQLLASKPWSTFPRWFTMPWMEDIWGYTPDELRPFPAFSYQVTALWGAGAPEGHHLLNIALHAANALLVMAITRTAARLAFLPAAFAAAVFALLPSAAESVAWITGRVDSLPALFYMASFLAYARWRDREGRGSGYAWSLCWFFLALFSKQNTITMTASLLAFDHMVSRQPLRLSWQRVRPYVPFALMTCGYLLLRYAVFGEALRERQLSAQRWEAIAAVLWRHLQRIALGDTGGVPSWAAILMAALTVAALAAIVMAPQPSRARTARAMAYFGLVWVALGVAPAVAAGYESPRHVYLAAAGWAVALGAAVEALAGRARLPMPVWRPLWSAAAALLVVSVLCAHGIRLTRAVSDWRARAEVSRRAVEQVEIASRAAPAGALVIVGAPVSSWEWAVPFAARPPFAGADATAHVHLIAPRLLHCCRGAHWDGETRRALGAWSAGASREVVAVHVAPDGEVRRLTSGRDPQLRALAEFLPQIASEDALDGAVQDVLRKLVAGRGEVVLPRAFRRDLPR